jgi:Flp pilus assembly CpaE family ATPase
VATHLAAGLARRGIDCILADLDLGSNALAGTLGIPDDASPATSADLLGLDEELAPPQVRELVWRHPEGFGVLVSPGRTVPQPSIGPDAVPRALTTLARSASVVVAHLPRELSEHARSALGCADRVLVVVQLDVASFREARAMLEAERLGARMEIVVNQARRGEITPRDVDRVFGQAPLAVVPFDRAVRAAQDRGRLLPRRGRTGRALDALAGRVQEGLA